MGSGRSGLYSGADKSQPIACMVVRNTATLVDRPLFVNGRVTQRSLSKFREQFYGKSVYQINSMLQSEGYETTIRKSKHKTSKAQIIVTTNPNKDRNITQVQVSPGSPRHGNIPYVKISTTNLGIVKIIDGKKSDYKTDGSEKATIYFRRNHK